MKKTILLILILLGLRQVVSAQGYVLWQGSGPFQWAPQWPPGQFPYQLWPGFPYQWSPDFLYQWPGNLMLNVNFSPLPDSPGTNRPSGTASYFYLYNQGNNLNISISLGTNQATDAWLVQENSDGSYAPIIEFTNGSYSVISPYLNAYDPGLITATNYYYSQTLVLTTNQVQALIEGKCYAEVSYGNDEYLGELSRAYVQLPYPAIAISPASEFESPSVTVFPGGNGSATVISPALNKPARVTLDGSNSIDPFYLPLQFMWWNGNDPIADTARTTLSLMPGNYAFQLEATDGYSTNSAMAMVTVISPEEAVGGLSSTVAQAGLNPQTARYLTSMLQWTQIFLEHGSAPMGARELLFFQDEVNSQFGKMDSSTGFYLYNGAADIIKAVGGSPVRYGHPIVF